MMISYTTYKNAKKPVLPVAKQTFLIKISIQIKKKVGNVLMECTLFPPEIIFLCVSSKN